MHLLTEQIDKAISDFDRALEINPGFPIAYVQKLYTDYRAALEKNDQEKIQNVINSFEQAVDKFPDCVETYALFAQVLCDQQKFEKADSYYERAIKVDPSNANLLGKIMLFEWPCYRCLVFDMINHWYYQIVFYSSPWLSYAAMERRRQYCKDLH